MPRPRMIGQFCMGALCLVGVGLIAALPHSSGPIENFRIVFGLHDRQSSSWDGNLGITGGRLLKITGWRFDRNDRLVGSDHWICRTHEYPLAGGRPAGEPRDTQPFANGIDFQIEGADAQVTVHFKQGDFSVRPRQVRFGEPALFLGGQVRVERRPAAISVRPAQPFPTEGARQDDYPALWIDPHTHKEYLAWVCYQNRRDRVLIAFRPMSSDRWSEPTELSGPGDHFRVALAGSDSAGLWAVWSVQRAGRWNLVGRCLRGAAWGTEVPLTDTAGPNLWHRMAADSQGRVWLVWQAFENGHSLIRARGIHDRSWSQSIAVCADPGNAWDPVVAADPLHDLVWFGWDQYRADSYQVFVRSLSGGPEGQWGPRLSPGIPGIFSAHIALACDPHGRLWAAWDQSGPQWGKDRGFLFRDTGATRLYESRRVRLACLSEDHWQEPAVDMHANFPADLKDFTELPELQFDRAGRLWLLFRHVTSKRRRADGWANQGRWDVFATAFLGDRWLFPTEMADSGGRNDMRASLLPDGDAICCAYATDNRGWLPPQMPPRNHSISISELRADQAIASYQLRHLDPQSPSLPPAVHPHEAQDIARVRAHAIDHGGQRLHIYRGDLHRHTDISLDGIGDGSLMDLYRYAIDAAGLDFILVTDHNMGHDNEYNWWRTQKSNDLYTVPGAFTALYGYERSVPYPNGHRNIIWLDRGHRTLPVPLAGIPARMAADTGRLYENLRQTGGLCTPHTSATQQGTNWSQHDDALEPIVEIFQGLHASYEAPKAPDAVTEQMAQVHGPLHPDGYISHALEKGYRLGFQASSDHVSTHVGYACLIAEGLGRKELIDAIRKRHTYAATDNILLDVRIGSAGVMGDEVHVRQPELDVQVQGTGPIDRVEIIRNNELIHTEKPTENDSAMHFRWPDPAPPPGEAVAYYYVRVLQRNGHLAWASPTWTHLDR